MVCVGWWQEELRYSLAAHGAADGKTQACRTWLADLWIRADRTVGGSTPFLPISFC